jgi:hypothetical protein
VISRTAAPETTRVVRLSTLACLVLAGVVAIGLAVAGHGVDGVFVAAGMVIGASNAWMAQRLINLGIPFAATSMLRIMTLTLVAGIVGLAGGLNRVFLAIAGVGIAQLVMAVSALRELNRR